MYSVCLAYALHHLCFLVLFSPSESHVTLGENLLLDTAELPPFFPSDQRRALELQCGICMEFSVLVTLHFAIIVKLRPAGSNNNKQFFQKEPQPKAVVCCIKQTLTYLSKSVVVVRM